MKKRSDLAVMLRLVGLVKPLMGFMALAIAMGVAGFLCAQFIPIFGGLAIVKALGGAGLPALSVLFACMGVFALARGVLRYAEQACNHYIAFKLLALIRDKVFGALRRLAPAKLDGRDKGDLIAVITSDIELLEVFYAHTLSPIAIAAIMSVIMTVFIGSYHWLLGLVAALGFFAVGVVVPVLAARFGGSRGLEYRTQAGALSAFVLDSLRGLGELLQYDAGQRRLDELDERTGSLLATEKKMKTALGTATACTGALIWLFSLAMLAAGSLLYTNGLVGFDGVLIPLIAILSSFGPVVALANLGSTLQQTFAAANRVLDILDEEPVVAENTTGRTIPFTGAACDNVSFTYEAEPILKNVSLTLPENKIIGITGRSGSGKSTLLKLLMRFWDVGDGAVAISGENVKNIRTASLRNLQSYVTQETYLFHDSIEENVKLAKPDATHEEVVEACKKASVHDFIMSLPNGYDTNVGELGDTLSGGERQRLGIARAFLHDAPLILLDEPTSNLDSLNEAVILQSLHRQRKGKTVVLVSHRASTMRIADTTYSVEHGRLS